MDFVVGVRLTEKDKMPRTAKLLECLEQGGEKINDEEIGLRKPYFKNDV